MLFQSKQMNPGQFACSQFCTGLEKPMLLEKVFFRFLGFYGFKGLLGYNTRRPDTKL